MRVLSEDIDIYTVGGLWHWEYGPFCSEDGFETETDALDDAETFLESVTQEEFDAALEEEAELELEGDDLI